MSYAAFQIGALVVLAILVLGVVGYLLFVNPALRRMRLKEMDKVQKMTPEQMLKKYGPRRKKKKS